MCIRDRFQDAPYPYWSVDVVSLSESGARKLLEIADSDLGVEGTLVDPKRFLTMHMDRSTVEILVKALEKLDGEESQSMLEDMTEWLLSANSE